MHRRFWRAARRYRGTSKEAWAAIQPHLPEVDHDIFAFIVRTGGSTSEEIEQGLGMRHQTVSAEISHMTDAGFLVDGGGRRKTSSNRKAIVWEQRPPPKSPKVLRPE
jgi:hypothetical protein